MADSPWLRVTPAIKIHTDELTERFIRAPGPGGQNVNKVASAVQLRFDVRHTQSLPEDVRSRLLHQARGRINNRGQLIIEARRYRARERNREDARQRLCALIRKATVKPTVRRKTKIPTAVTRRRLTDKRKRGTTKKLRSTPSED